jgi:hypothetical protein
MFKHGSSDKLNVKRKTCIHPDCKTQPSFNKEGESTPLYCSRHKLKNMVNVKNKTCIHPDCKTQPTFNNEGETTALYCSEHKLDWMIDVKHKTCIHPNCKIIPIFNKEGESIAMYCATHKKEGMVDIKNKSCIHSDCKKQPAFNKEGETTGLYCSAHKLDGMVNVKDKTCIHPDCKIIPAFNKEGETTRLYCLAHKLDGMVNIHKTCIHLDCKKQPSFNKEGESTGLYCSLHKLDNMVDCIHPKCKTHLCFTIVLDKYDGYCLRCYINLFPEKSVSKNYKTKEFAVVEFIKNEITEYNWISDKQIKEGCSKRRPDLLLDLGYQVIIIEVDENQHIDYDCSCENKRLMQLSQDLGHRPIIFIRFNPDDYINQDSEKIVSCWGYNKSGISIIKKTQKKEWRERLESLKQQINYWSNPENVTNKTIEIIQLYYNQL